MNPIHPIAPFQARRQTPRFSGYTLLSGNQAAPYLPGYSRAKSVLCEWKAPNGKLQQTPLNKDNHYWRWPSEVTLHPTIGSQYRFIVDGKPVLDLTEQVSIEQPFKKDAAAEPGAETVSGAIKETYNLISSGERLETQARSAGPLLDVFSDSLLAPEQLSQFTDPIDPYRQDSRRSHFNRYAGNEEGLMNLLGELQKLSKNKTGLKSQPFDGILFKPFIGGDNLSSHRYWTIDPFVLNETFSSPVAFKQFLNSSLRNGISIFADGAFVNQGLNGVQYLSNLQHGLRSPYWNWFLFPNHDASSDPYPDHIKYGKLKMGVLPTKIDATTQTQSIDYDRFDIKIINDPSLETHQAAMPVMIELESSRKTATTTRGKTISQFTDAVQAYRFPVPKSELQKKKDETQKLYQQRQQGKLSESDYEIARKKLWINWQHFTLVDPAQDDSGIKWNGQIDVAKMNMKNPEVQGYLTQAMTYWTKLVSNTYLETITSQLNRLRQTTPDIGWEECISILGGKTTAVLPPLTEAPSPERIKAAIEQLTPTDITGTSLIRQSLSDYPLTALPVPAEIKGLFSYPKLPQIIFESSHGWRKSVDLVLSPVLNSLSKLKPIQPLAQKVSDWLQKNRLSQQLGRVFDEAMYGLDETNKSKLESQAVRDLIAQSLGEWLLLQLFTGQSNSNTEAVKAGLVQTLSPALLQSDPVSGSYMLGKEVRKQAKKITPERVTAFLNQRLKNIDPRSLAIGQLVLDDLGLGLNWRIDAAKDVADIDAVANLDGKDRSDAFLKEMDFASAGFWSPISEEIRQIFPKARIIAELTDFRKLANDDQNLATSAYQKFFKPPSAESSKNSRSSNSVFTSTPNMDYMYSAPLQLINFDPRPDEFGGRQMQPSDFINLLQAMTTSVPKPVWQQYQNMTSSHDYATTAHRLLLNPEIATMDRIRWWGIKNDLIETLREWKDKPCFQPEQNRLGLSTQQVQQIASVLLNALTTDNLIQKMPPSVQAYWVEGSKSQSGNSEPTPVNVKEIALETLFEQTIPQLTALKLSATDINGLERSLKANLTTASESKAMRAVVINALSEPKVHFYLEKQFPDPIVKQQFLTRFYEALQESIDIHGQGFGYLPVEQVLTDIMDRIPENVYPEQLLIDLKHRMFLTIMAPVYAKLQRLAAIQVAAPGNPSVYLPDLLGQTGGELTKNRFIQNRNLIRLDWLTRIPAVAQQSKRILELMSLRQRVPVLNDGFVLKPTVNNEEGVLPIIRDNGTDQAIMLINTGKPQDLEFNAKVGTEATYPEVATPQAIKHDFKLDCSTLGFAPGTQYQDADSGERFVINPKGLLVSAKNPSLGISIGIYRCLTRVNS